MFLALHDICIILYIKKYKCDRETSKYVWWNSECSFYYQKFKLEFCLNRENICTINSGYSTRCPAHRKADQVPGLELPDQDVLEWDAFDRHVLDLDVPDTWWQIKMYWKYFVKMNTNRKFDIWVYTQNIHFNVTMATNFEIW